MSAGGRSRTAALALLVGVVVVAGAAVVVPAALHWSKTGAIIRDARGKIQRAELRSAGRGAVERTRSAWNGFVSAPTSGFLLVDNDEAAIEALRERIASAFSRLGGSVGAIETVAEDGPRDGVRSIAIDVQATLPRANLGPLLTSLESEPAFIIVTRFEAAARSGDTLRLEIGGKAYRLLEPGA